MSATVAAVAVLIAFHAIIAIHELGHAIAARATGLRIRRLVLGFGGIGRFRITLKARVAGVPVEIRPVPIYGLTEVDPDELSAPWAAAVITTLAGPVANIAAGAATLAIIAGPDRAIMAIRTLAEALWHTTPEIITQGLDALRPSWQPPSGMRLDFAGDVATIHRLLRWPQAALALSAASIALGLSNLLPIPPLDGSKLVMLALRWVPGFRKKATRAAISAAGLVLFLVIQAPFLRANWRGILQWTAVTAAILLPLTVLAALAAAREARAHHCPEGGER
jgi:membrane-associated protease RseP (regulator of RpoE activity)